MANGHGDEGGSSWPYRSLLLAGYFGADAPAGRRLRRRVWLALLGLPLVNLLPVAPGLQALRPMLWRLVLPVSLPSAVAVIVWAYVRYLGELDELSRLIQLEALAFSYGAAMTLAALCAALDVVARPAGGALHGLTVFLVLMLAELLRGVVLVLRARRRQ